MKNNFTVEVCFSEVPLYPYEWNNMSIISGVKVMRVTTDTIINLLTYKAKLNVKEKTIMLSDSKTALVLRLDQKGYIIKRSFLTFEQDLNVCEAAVSLKCCKLEYELLKDKLHYSSSLYEEECMKEYVVKSLLNIEDESESKYLYYLFFDEIEHYSKERLLDYISKNKPGNFKKVYDFLIAK